MHGHSHCAVVRTWIERTLFVSNREERGEPLGGIARVAPFSCLFCGNFRNQAIVLIDLSMSVNGMLRQLPVQVRCARRIFARPPSDKFDDAHYPQEPERQKDQSIYQYQHRYGGDASEDKCS